MVLRLKRRTVPTPPGRFVVALGLVVLSVAVVRQSNHARIASLTGWSSGPTILFQSDWSTATGTSDRALLDAGSPTPWALVAGNGRLNEVVPATGLGFPTKNVLRVEVNAQGQAQVHRYTGLAAPVAGASLYYRWYIRVVAPDRLADRQTHPFQDGLAARHSNWMFDVVTDRDGQWTMDWHVQATPWPDNHFRLQGLAKNTTYRVELRLHRTSVAAFNMHVRVFDSAGRLLHADEAFRNANGTRTLADVPSLNFVDVRNLSGLNAGINGLGSPPGPTVMYYQGGVAVCSGDWCGPYAYGR